MAAQLDSTDTALLVRQLNDAAGKFDEGAQIIALSASKINPFPTKERFERSNARKEIAQAKAYYFERLQALYQSAANQYRSSARKLLAGVPYENISRNISIFTNSLNDQLEAEATNMQTTGSLLPFNKVRNG